MTAASIATAQKMAVPLSILAFWYKSLRVGCCSFKITPTEICRSSKGRNLVVPWTEITEVYSCRRGLVLGKPRGGMPIPDRALSVAQRAELREIIAGHGLVVE